MCVYLCVCLYSKLFFLSIKSNKNKKTFRNMRIKSFHDKKEINREQKLL